MLADYTLGLLIVIAHLVMILIEESRRDPRLID
jgi:hypothetical protein